MQGITTGNSGVYSPFIQHHHLPIPLTVLYGTRYGHDVRIHAAYSDVKVIAFSLTLSGPVVCQGSCSLSTLYRNGIDLQAPKILIAFTPCVFLFRLFPFNWL